MYEKQIYLVKKKKKSQNNLNVWRANSFKCKPSMYEKHAIVEPKLILLKYEKQIYLNAKLS